MLLFWKRKLFWLGIDNKNKEAPGSRQPGAQLGAVQLMTGTAGGGLANADLAILIIC